MPHKLINLVVFAVLFGLTSNTSLNPVFSQQKETKVAKNDLYQFIPDESFLVFQGSAKHLWSTLSKDNEEILETVTDIVADRTGFGAGDIEEVLFGVTTLAGAHERSIPVFFGFKLKESTNRKEVLDAFQAVSEKGLFDGIPTSPNERRDRGAVFCFPGDRLVLIAERQVMERMIGKKKGNPIVKRVKKLREKSISSMVAEFNGKEERAEAIQKLLKMPFGMMQLTDLNDVFEGAKSMEASLFKGDTFAKGKYIGLTENESSTAIEIAEDSKDTAVDYLEERIERLKERGDRGKPGIKLINMMTKIIESVKFKQRGKEVAFEVSFPGGYKAITNLSVEISEFVNRRR